MAKKNAKAEEVRIASTVEKGDANQITEATSEEDTMNEEISASNANDDEMDQQTGSIEQSLDVLSETKGEDVYSTDELNDEASDNDENVYDDFFDSLDELELVQVVPSFDFRSDSEMARYYILELLEDRESHKKQELVTYITERSGKVISDAIIINVLRNCVATGSLMQLERGSYRLGTGVGLVSKLIAFIESTRKGLDKISLVSVSEITDSDIYAIQDVKALKSILDVMYEKLTTSN